MGIANDLGVDAVLITNGTNRRYLTGFTAEDHAPDESSGVVVVSGSELLLLISPTNLPWAQSEAQDSVTVLAAPRPWTSAVAREILSRGFARVGFEEVTMTVLDYSALMQALQSSVELVPIGDGIDRLRAVKGPRELASLESALKLTDVAFEAATDQLRPGMTELQVSEIIRAELRNAGSEGEAFPTIVASGPHAAKPHHVPAVRLIREREPIIIDMGARVDGYCGDLTRTVWIGQPDDQLLSLYSVVADAQKASIDSVRAGVACREVDQASRDVFEAAGLSEYIIHGVGHGVGLRVHEAPSLSQASTETLRAGNVITVEPGLYLPGWGGVRIEDVLLVEDEGARNLTGASKHTL